MWFHRNSGTLMERQPHFQKLMEGSHLCSRRMAESVYLFYFYVIYFLHFPVDSDLCTMAMAVITILSFAGGYNVTYQLGSELFPTVVRGRIVLFQRLLGDVGGLLGAQVASLVSRHYVTHARDRRTREDKCL